MEYVIRSRTVEAKGLAVFLPLPACLSALALDFDQLQLVEGAFEVLS